MKVLMTADAMGGVWQYALELVRALGPNGVDVVLATMGRPPDGDQRREVAQLPNAELCVGDYKLEWMDSPWQDVAAAGAWLLELEARHRPDVVHLNGYAHGSLPWQAPLLIVGHSCVVSWWLAVKGEGPPATWDWYRSEVAAGLHAADAVVAPSRAMLGALREHYGPFARARVISNARNAKEFRPALKEPFILSTGRLWDEAKNLKVLEQVAAALPWPVYVAGEDCGPNGNAVCSRSTRHLGRLSTETVSDWLGRAAIFAHPARYEPFGLSVLEAALSGCALVLGDIESLREIWGDAAVFVPPNDPRTVENALRRLIDQPAQRALLADRALVRARQYKPQIMAQKYFTVYRELEYSGHHTPSPGTPGEGGGEGRLPPVPSRKCQEREPGSPLSGVSSCAS